MSGLETLAALGLACNIFQVISFAGEVYRHSKNIFEEGQVPDSATTLVRTPESLVKAFYDAKRKAEQATRPLTPNDHELLNIAEDCRKAITALTDEVNKFAKTAGPKGKLVGSVIMGAKSVVKLRGKKVKELKQQLEVH